MLMNLNESLRANSYPGRGILLGRSADGRKAVIAYFIMGRSENSRNRIFEETDDGIRTRAFDESRMTDPSLIIYHPVRVVEGTTIVTNGDQTDTVAEAFRRGEGWVRALRTREFEPDGGPIVLQRAVDIQEGDTPETLQRRVMEQAEWVILPRAVSLFCQDRLVVKGRTVHILPACEKEEPLC